MRCRFQSACVFAVLTLGLPSPLHAELQPQPPSQPPALHETSATNQQPPPNSQEKLARIWANEPPLLRLARDKFGAELSETDAKFFAAVTAGEWADFRPSADATYNTQEPSSWAESTVLKADRIVWLVTDAAAKRLVSSRGIWIRGAKIEGKIELYRSEIPFSLTVYDCLLAGGINLAHAKLQELDIRDSCAAGVQARGVQIAENVYLLKSTVSGGLDFFDAQIGGDFDFSGGLALHGTKDDIGKPGVSLNLHDAKVGGDVKLAEKFRAFGQVRLIGAQIGRGLSCTGGQFAGAGQMAIDAQRSSVAGIVSFTAGFRADGGVEMRRSRIGGDLDCDGGRLIGYGYEPFRAIKIGLAIIVVGAVVFAIGAHRGLMAETKLAEHVLSQEGEPRIVSPTYPRFNPFVYSLDVFLPFVDLHQICYWIPGERVTKPRTSRNCLMHLGPYSLKWSAVLRGYLWFQTLAGWTLCTLLAAAVTGIVES